MDPTLLGFIVYLIIILAVGFVTVRLTKTLADFILAGRKLGPWVVSFSERASGESAWLLIGLPGLALATGFEAIWAAIGCCAGIFFSWVFISERLRTESEKFGALTLPDFFETRYDDRSHAIRIVSTIIIVFFFTLYVSAQFLAAGKVLNATFGISTLTGMMIGACIILFYTIMGGFFAVAWTDLFQGLIVIVTLVLLPIVGIFALGGFGNIAPAVSKIDPKLLTIAQGKTGLEMILAVAGGLGIGLGYMGQPHLLARFMAIKDPKKLRQGSLIAMSWALLAFWGAVFIGIVGMGLFKELITDQEQIMPMMANLLLPAGLAGVLISGAIAAMMSTADSQLLVTTSAISEDIYHQMMNKEASQRRLVMISRVGTICIGMVAFVLAITAKQLVYWLVLYAWAGLGASFGPALLLTLWWKKTTKWGVLAGMIVGTVTVLVWYNLPVLKNFLYELIPGFFFALLAIVVVSLLGKRKTAEL